MAAVPGALSSVPEVEIDPEGTFKYILVRVQGSGAEGQRDIVRGTAAAEFHNHIFEKVNLEMEKLGFTCKCLGGGKIEHHSKDKKIHVFGLSTRDFPYQVPPSSFSQAWLTAITIMQKTIKHGKEWREEVDPIYGIW